MSTVQTLSAVDLVREHIEAFSANDWDAFKSSLTPDAIYDEMATGTTLRGPDAIVEGLKIWKMAYPDLKGTISRYTGDERLLAVELTWEGTFSGDLMTPAGVVKATGRHDTLPAAEFITFEGSKVAAIHHYFDLGSALR